MLHAPPKINKIILCFIIIVFLLPLSANAFTSASTTNQKLIQDFIKIAYGSEYGKNKSGMRKWLKPVRYSIEGTPTQHGKKLFHQHIKYLSSVTGLTIEQTKIINESNLHIVWAEKKDYHLIANKYFKNQRSTRIQLLRSNCFFRIKTTAKQEIVEGLVILPPNFPEPKLKHCIVEELTQAMGLVNDNLSVLPSMFNDRYTLNTLSWKDELFLKILYDPETPVGLKIDKASSVLAPIVKRLREP